MHVLTNNHSADAAAELKTRNIDFGSFPDLEGAVKDDVQLLKETKLVGKGVGISGWVYEVETGKVKRVV